MDTFRPPAFAGLIGVARRDITPPVGIYARNWGAALHEVAEGIHMPMSVTALVLSNAADASPDTWREAFVVVSMDFTWWRTGADEWALRSALIEALQLDPARVLINITHTHAGPATCRDDVDKPGGHLILAYIDLLTAQVIAAVREAAETLRPATLTWAYGTCGLAQNRDLVDPDSGGLNSVGFDKLARIVCGWNPQGTADDTLLVGRVTTRAGDVLATLVNYACHPTTLAWDNKLISPDFIGTLREVVEASTGGAPCLFLQGASGELSPIEQYTGDVSISEKHGRMLGYAVLSTLQGMLPAGMGLRYGGLVESGAPLAVWQRQPIEASQELAAEHLLVEVDLKGDLPTLAQIQEDLDDALAEGNIFLIERFRRRLRVRHSVGDEPTSKLPAWAWRVGDSLWLAQGNEAYSDLQVELRARFPGVAVVVMNLTNGPQAGYLPPRALYGRDVYPVWQSPYAAGGLERMIESSAEALAAL